MFLPSDSFRRFDDILKQRGVMCHDPLVARTGRDRQRYHEGNRLVVGAIPYQRIGNKVSVLLVKSRRHEEWCFPKGGWENDESAAEGALREAFEEGGVVGKLGNSLAKREIKRAHQVHEYFALEIHKLEQNWPERPARCRKLVDIVEAQALLGRQTRRKDMIVQLESLHKLTEILKPLHLTA